VLGVRVLQETGTLSKASMRDQQEQHQQRSKHHRQHCMTITLYRLVALPADHMSRMHYTSPEHIPLPASTLLHCYTVIASGAQRPD
jgi:hypothetical protein